MHRPSTSAGLRALTRSRQLIPISHFGKSSGRTFLTIIEQGHEGWRLRFVPFRDVCLEYTHLCEWNSFGRNPIRLEPGLNVKIPGYHTVLGVDLRESSIAIPNVSSTVLLGNANRLRLLLYSSQVIRLIM